MALIENIPLNIKNWHEMCQEMFSLSLVKAISDMPRLEICFLPG